MKISKWLSQWHDINSSACGARTTSQEPGKFGMEQILTAKKGCVLVISGEMKIEYLLMVMQIFLL